MIKDINKAMHSLEYGLNVAGSIPFVGMFSGSLRVMIGKIQLIAGAVFAAAGFIGKMVDKKHKAKWKKIMHNGLEHMGHGALNMVRGSIEATLAYTFFGSFIPLIIQLTTSRGFKPRFKYSGVS